MPWQVTCVVIPGLTPGLTPPWSEKQRSSLQNKSTGELDLFDDFAKSMASYRKGKKAGVPFGTSSVFYIPNRIELTHKFLIG